MLLQHVPNVSDQYFMSFSVQGSCCSILPADVWGDHVWPQVGNEIHITQVLQPSGPSVPHIN